MTYLSWNMQGKEAYFRYNHDGEPSGTAGLPINEFELEIISREYVEDKTYIRIFNIVIEIFI